ncbi:hypothetical protein [Nocardioides sp. R-C-SC26]|uniref:hypothetical protein n=1 Tax=Nocardioides sp. R-C-SC26 TaxID=2870414 RepID=UPI001E3FD942|nr:hypothetical protein [Nocardioides sp. R-C-SC26]
MITRTTRRPVRRSLIAAGALVAGALAAAVPTAPAQAAGAGSGGTITWGMSTYLGSTNPGRPNPYAAGYVAPATFDATSRLSTWGAGSGTIADTGAADLDFDGTSVNFASTSGSWLRISDLAVDVDATGNGTLSGEVSYGMSTTGTPGALTYDPAQAPSNGPTRVAIVALAGNTAADVARTDAGVTYTGLDGTWTDEFKSFLAAWPYAATFTTAADRQPLPVSIAATTATAAVQTGIISATPSGGLKVGVAGTGFTSALHSKGVYAGLAVAGGLPELDGPDQGMGAFVPGAIDFVMANRITDGSFTSILAAATSDLDRTKSYSVYVWPHATNPTPANTIEAPVAINWSKLMPASKRKPTVKVAWLTKPSASRTSKAKVTVRGQAGAATGKVTLRLVDPDGWKSTKTLKKGATTFVVPRLRPGKWTYVLRYAGDRTYQASTTRGSFRATR